MWPLLENSRPPFDRDTYRILTKAVASIQACQGLREPELSVPANNAVGAPARQG